MPLAGKSVFLAGGREDLALALARAGARLIVHADEHGAGVVRALLDDGRDGRLLSPGPAGVEDAERLVDELWAQGGAISGAVFAPRFDPPGGAPAAFVDQPPDLWRRLVATHLELPFFLVRALASRMKGEGGGAIVIVATRPGARAGSMSCVASTGLVTLTAGLAKVLPEGVVIAAVVGGSAPSQAAHVAFLLCGRALTSGTIVNLDG
jgi:NAD(P)-dependent dehydrogenase (short-subunit alcohol dehydrogenase family)